MTDIQPDVEKVDFDHHSVNYRDNAATINEDLRSRCPIAHTDAHGGYYVLTKYDYVSEAARDWETYSSWKDIPAGSGPLTGATLPDAHPDTRQGFAEMDGPIHRTLRQPLAPYFTPAAAEKLRPETEMYADWCIDQFIERGSADLVNELAGPVPSLLAMRMMGLPLGDWRAYADSAHKAFYTVPGTPAYDELASTRAWLHSQLVEAVHDRRANPTDDLTSLAANLRVDGELLAFEDAVGTVQLLLFGGVDTTTNLLANAFVYLSENREARAWLAEDLSRLENACEEFLRYFAPVQGLARTVVKPAKLGGKEFEHLDRVWMSWAGANRDPEAFPDPEAVQLDRFPNRHTSFGLGPHRCLGSAQARMLFDVVMRATLTRLGDFSVDTENAHRYPSIGVMNGWTEVPVTFTPGPAVGVQIPELAG